MTDGTNPWSPKSLEWTHTESPPGTRQLPETRSSGRELDTLQLQLSAELSWLAGR